MIEELIALMGRKELLQVMACTTQSLDDWRKGKGQTHAARKLIWLLWALYLHPERCKTTWDVITWGQYHKYPVHWIPRPDDYQI